MATHTFYRDPERKLVAGVCAAIAARMGIEATWLRLIVALLAMFTGGAVVWAYLILWAITPLGATGEAPISRWMGRAGSLFRPSGRDWPERL
jgi:phage shock protein PspC (stress-responsive transcriptional regulator)